MTCVKVSGNDMFWTAPLENVCVTGRIVLSPHLSDNVDKWLHLEVVFKEVTKVK